GDDSWIPFGRNESGSIAVREIEHRDRIGNRVCGKEILFVFGQRERLWIAAAMDLPLRLGGKRERSFAGAWIERDDLIAIRQRNEEQRIVTIQQECGRMRTARNRGPRLAKFDISNDFAARQVKFSNSGRVPKRDVAALSVIRDDCGVGKRTGNALERR